MDPKTGEDVGSPSISQADTWPIALFAKSFTGRKQGLSSPNSIPLHTCVKTREIWAKFFLDSTSIVEETTSNVSGVLGEIVHSDRRRSNNRDLHDGRVNRPIVDQPTEARSVLFLSGIGEFLPERSKSLAGEIPHAIWNFACRVDNRRYKSLAPPL